MDSMHKKSVFFGFLFLFLLSTAAFAGMETVGGASFPPKMMQSSRLLFVYFTADWCAPSKKQEPILNILADKYRGSVDFYKVDADASKALVSKYGVKSVPTMVLFYKGTELDRLVGLSSKVELDDFFCYYTEMQKTGQLSAQPVSVKAIDMKDLKIGPFQCGGQWDPALAERCFGKRTMKSEAAVNPDTVYFDLNGILWDTTPKGNTPCYYIEHAGASFLISENKIRFIQVKASSAETPGKIRCGDLVGKIRARYPVETYEDKIYRELHASEAGVFDLVFYANEGGFTYCLFFFIDRQSREVVSMALLRRPKGV